MVESGAASPQWGSIPGGVGAGSMWPRLGLAPGLGTQPMFISKSLGSGGGWGLTGQ